MTLTVTIYNAFSELVTAFAAAQDPELQVAYPGLDFDPPDDAIWIDYRVFNNDGENYALEDDGPTIEKGFYRLIVCTQPGAGVVAAQTVAELIVAEFPKGTEFATARIYDKPTIGGPLPDGELIVIPVTIKWRATR